MELNGLEGYGLYLFLQKSQMTPEFIRENILGKRSKSNYIKVTRFWDGLSNKF